MTYVEIPSWVFFMLVIWCISYIALVVYLLRSTGNQMDEMRSDYMKRIADGIALLDSKIEYYKEKTDGELRDHQTYIDELDHLYDELNRDVAEYHAHMNERMNSMEKAFELLRQDCIPPCRANAEATAYETADGKVSILPYIFTTAAAENGELGGGTDEKEPENG